MKQDQELLLFMTLKEWTFWYRRRYNALVRLIQNGPQNVLHLPRHSSKWLLHLMVKHFTSCKYQMLSFGESTPNINLPFDLEWMHHPQRHENRWNGKSFYHSHQEDGYSHCIFIKHSKEMCSRMLWWIDHFK